MTVVSRHCLEWAKRAPKTSGDPSSSPDRRATAFPSPVPWTSPVVSPNTSGGGALKSKTWWSAAVSGRFEETVGDLDLVCVTADMPRAHDALAFDGHRRRRDRPRRQKDVRRAGLGDAGRSQGMRTRAAWRDAPVLYRKSASQRRLSGRLQPGMGLSLNEYGLKNVETGVLETYPTEEELYERLGLQYVPPETPAWGRGTGSSPLTVSYPTLCGRPKSGAISTPIPTGVTAETQWRSCSLRPSCED